MKVFLLCRSIEHPQHSNPNAPQIGDIVQVRRADKEVWGKELKPFTIVKVDLNIPCEEAFKQYDKGGRCRDCPNNDVDHCEFQKYIKPEYDTGSLLEEPTVIKKRRYKAVYYPPPAIITAINKGISKSKADEDSILLWAQDNEQLKSIVMDKKTNGFSR